MQNERTNQCYSRISGKYFVRNFNLWHGKVPRKWSNLGEVTPEAIVLQMKIVIQDWTRSIVARNHNDTYHRFHLISGVRLIRENGEMRTEIGKNAIENPIKAF